MENAGDDDERKRGTPGRPKDRQNTENALVDAAVEVFGAKGFEKATTRELAARAGCAEALIHRYFDSKDGLLLAVFQRCGRPENVSVIAALPPATSVLAEIQQILGAAVAFISSHRTITRIVLSRALVDPSFKKLLENTLGRKERREVLVQRLRVHVEAGRIAADANLHAFADAVSMVAFHIGFLRPESVDSPPDEVASLIESYARILSEGIRAR